MTTKKLSASSKEIVAAVDWSQHEGRGLEGTTKDDFKIPFLSILQAQSPQLKAIKEARAGMFLNTITNEVWSTVRVIPCGFQRVFVRWAPRAGGGGYKGQIPYDQVLDSKQPLQGLSVIQGQMLMDVPPGEKNPFDEKGKPRYDHLADTRYHYCLAQGADGQWQQVLIGLASSQIKRSRHWMTLLSMRSGTKPSGEVFTLPSYSHVYRISAAEEKNAQGEWYGHDVALDGPIPTHMIAPAVKFYEAVMAGHVDIAQPVDDSIERGNVV